MSELDAFSNDEIDLRGLIRSLIRYKWWILGVTVVFVLAALLALQLTSKSKVFQARALLVFGQPILNMSNPGTSSTSNAAVNLTSLPDSKGITDLATVDDVLYSVYQSPTLANQRSEGLTFGRLKAGMSASLSGTNQLLLQASDPNPQQAAQIANLWAQAVADRLNELYSSSSNQITTLEEQTKGAQQAWESADKALADYLQQSKVDGLTARLTQAQVAYNSQLGKLNSIDLLLSDGRALNARLAAQPETTPLSAGDAIGLLGLKQRAEVVLLCSVEPVSTPLAPSNSGPAVIGLTNPQITCTSYNGMEGLQLQITDQGLLMGQTTVAGAQQDLKSFTDSLQNQQTELKSNLDRTDAQLASLHSQVEAAQFQAQELTTRRDLAAAAYQTIYSELTNTRVEIAANGEVARVAGKALPPTSASQSRATLIVPIAGLLGLVLSVVWFYAKDWWELGNKHDLAHPGPEVPKSEVHA